MKAQEAAVHFSLYSMEEEKAVAATSSDDCK